MATDFLDGADPDGTVTHPYGEDAQGNLIYTSGGWMTGMLAGSDRANLVTHDVVGGSEAQRAAAVSSYLAYCGTYEVGGNVVVHSIAMSMFPNWGPRSIGFRFRTPET